MVVLQDKPAGPKTKVGVAFPDAKANGNGYFPEKYFNFGRSFDSNLLWLGTVKYSITANMTESNTLPKPLADFIAAQNEFNTDAFVKTFADNATVHDEGGDYRGSAEIKRWNETTNEKYKTKMEAIAFVQSGGESILTIMMSGTFPGSPLPAKFHFVLKEGKIASLRIV